MGYRIEYGADGSKTVTARPEKQRKKRNSFIWAIWVICVIGMLACKPVRHAVREMMIPGSADVTATAMDCFVSELEQGKGIADAFAVFCREVIRSGG